MANIDSLHIFLALRLGLQKPLQPLQQRNTTSVRLLNQAQLRGHILAQDRERVVASLYRDFHLFHDSNSSL